MTEHDLSLFFIDVETDGLLREAESIHVVCIEDDSGSTWTCRSPQSLQVFLRGLPEDAILVGHNIIAFDVPVVKKIWDVSLDIVKLRDTMIMSQFILQRRPGGHSLENLARMYKLKQQKVEHEDWSAYSPEMLHRCQTDVSMTRDVYHRLVSEIDSRGSNLQALAMEYDMASILAEAQAYGLPFDAKGAESIVEELKEDLRYIDPIIRHHLSCGFLRAIREVTPKAKKDGNLSRVGVPKTFYLTEVSVGCPFTLVEPQPVYPKFIVDRLFDLDLWQPTERTDTAIANIKLGMDPDDTQLSRMYKMSETNLHTIKDQRVAVDLLSYVIVKTRLSTLESWLKAYDEGDERLHGNIRTIGTWTHRMSHNNPNLGNIAGGAVRKYKEQELVDLVSDLGVRMRRLYRAEKDRVFVGSDADGIQLRALAHYYGDPEYTEEIVSGDIHTKNWEALGKHICRTRDDAKTFIYSWLLGAAAPKTAEVLGVSVGEAVKARTSFLNAYPGLKALKEGKIKQDVTRGGFYGVDGRFIENKSEHTMLAGYLQEFEATCMKHAVVWAHRETTRLGLDAHLVAFVHDETLWDCHPDVADKLGAILERSYVVASEKLGTLAPVSGGYAKGDNWYDVH